MIRSVEIQPPASRQIDRAAIRGALLIAAFIAASMMSNAASAQQCPSGYRLHYQGFCINTADELTDDPTKEIRTLEPTGPLMDSQADIFEQLATTAYKFSNMIDGEYCKMAYVRISRSETKQLVAFALGDESCGFSHEPSASLDAARAEAVAKCEKHTTNCRIIFPENSN